MHTTSNFSSRWLQLLAFACGYNVADLHHIMSGKRSRRSLRGGDEGLIPQMDLGHKRKSRASADPPTISDITSFYEDRGDRLPRVVYTVSTTSKCCEKCERPRIRIHSRAELWKSDNPAQWMKEKTMGVLMVNMGKRTIAC